MVSNPNKSPPDRGLAALISKGLIWLARRLGGDLDTDTSETAPNLTQARSADLIYTALDALAEVIVIWDRDDKLLLANQLFYDLNQDISEHTTPGTAFDDYNRARSQSLHLVGMAEALEETIALRAEHHRNPGPPFEVTLPDDITYRIFHRRLPDGAIITVGLDISEQKRRERQLQESEQRFRDFASTSADWYWEQDENLCFTYVGIAAAGILGRAQETFIGLTRRDSGGMIVEDAAFRAHEQQLERREPFDDFRYNRITESGEKIHLTISGKPLFDAEGTFKGYRGAARDITAIIAANEELNQALARAETANRAKSEFLARMSHDFRTPLNAILGYSEMISTEIRGPVGNDHYLSYAKDIHDSGKLLLHFVSDLLDLAKIEAGQRELMPVDLELAELIREIVSLSHPQISFKELQLTVTIEPADLMLYADRSALQQILLNAISNATKFTPTGGAIEIQAHRRGGGTAISIKDNGIGFHPNELENILTPFGRSRRADELAIEGTGLGLSILKALTEAHGGSFEIAGVLEAGATVDLFFPEAQI